ncbi:MAG: hypothetical protein Q9208_003995 [Pyrenodesmia sp. 3 TL-2023]
MSRIEDLPDELETRGASHIDTTLPLPIETPFPIRPKPATGQDASTAPPLPPAMESVRSYSADEVVRMMKKTPLFMTNLEEVSGGDEGMHPPLRDNEDNIELEALRALQYEGTRAEVALGFKERGNEMVAEKRWTDAKEFYTKGILALKAPPKEEASAEDQAQKAEQRKLEEACYINRALCNLELQNFRSTLHDTSHTLLLTPTNSKAHYRSALALLSLARHDEALDSCTRGLALTSPDPESTNMAKRPSPEHAAFVALRTRILDAKRTADAAAHKRLNQEERRKKEQLTLNAAIRARGIRVRMTPQPPDLEDATIRLLPDPLSPTSVLHFPVLLLYPTHGQSDFVKQVAETELWGDVLRMVLGGGDLPPLLPFDRKGEFSAEGVESFMETREGGMVKVGRKVRLLDVLGGGEGKVEVVDMVVRVFVVPRARVKGWVEEMKARKEAQKS